MITQLPLTTANALDVWNAGPANRTSDTVRNLLSTTTRCFARCLASSRRAYTIDGKLFALPAGDLGLAFGAEYLRTHLDEYSVQGNNAGPASQGSNNIQLGFTRTVKSAFAEVRIPLISEDMGVPFAQSVNLNLSGRYDHYSDFGESSQTTRRSLQTQQGSATASSCAATGRPRSSPRRWISSATSTAST